jgi:hypothetical protein
MVGYHIGDALDELRAITESGIIDVPWSPAERK